MDLTESITPKSDQLNADDLMSGPRTVTITDVHKGSLEQPVDVVTAEFGPGRPFKPSKSMRRVMVSAWGVDSSKYTGRRMTLYRDPSIKFGKDEVGGIRISHMSDLKDGKPLKLALTITRGKRAPYVVQPLPDAPVPDALPARIDKMVQAFHASFGVEALQIEAKLGRKRGQWDADDVAALAVVFTSLTRGEAKADDEFGSGTDALKADTAEPAPDDADQAWVAGEES